MLIYPSPHGGGLLHYERRPWHMEAPRCDHSTVPTAERYSPVSSLSHERMLPQAQPRFYTQTAMSTSITEGFSHSLSGLFLCSHPFLDNPMLTFSTGSRNRAPPILSPMRALFHGQHAIWPGTRLVRWCCLAVRTDPHPHGNLTGPWGNKKKG